MPAQSVDAPRLLNARQVADRLGCSWRTIYRLADAGRFPIGRKVGALRRWSSIEVDEFIAGRWTPSNRRVAR